MQISSSSDLQRWQITRSNASATAVVARIANGKCEQTTTAIAPECEQISLRSLGFDLHLLHGRLVVLVAKYEQSLTHSI